MRIVVLLPDATITVLRRLGAAQHDIVEVSDARAMLEQLQRKRWNAVLLDPTDVREDLYEALLDAIARSSAMLLLVTPLTGRAAQRCLSAARRGIVEVIFCGREDMGVLLAAHLDSLVTPTARALLLHRLATSLQGLPTPLRVRTLGLFGATPPDVSVTSFSLGARMSRRTVERWITRVGFTGCHTLLRCVRLSHIWERLQRGERAHATTATDAGYDSWRTFSPQFKRLVGVAPTVAAARQSTSEFVDTLVAKLHGDF